MEHLIAGINTAQDKGSAHPVFEAGLVKCSKVFFYLTTVCKWLKPFAALVRGSIYKSVVMTLHTQCEKE